MDRSIIGNFERGGGSRRVPSPVWEFERDVRKDHVAARYKLLRDSA